MDAATGEAGHEDQVNVALDVIADCLKSDFPGVSRVELSWTVPGGTYQIARDFG